MKFVRLLTACVLVPAVLAGCASVGSQSSDSGARDSTLCVIGGAVAGAAAGVAVSADGGSGLGGLIGAAAGAVMGEVMCAPDQPMMMDADGDGVPDDKDQCPGTPAGVKVDAKGCPLDGDGDGVPDYLDKCPGTPAGVQVDKDGCPLDSDGDGVPDYRDQCPGTPKGTTVDDRGCPEKIAIVTNINFDFDRATLRPDSVEKLDQVVQILMGAPKVKVRIDGHTDSVGTEGYNMGLGLRRAEAVRNYLVDKGVDAGRLGVQSFGESQPLVSNQTRQGRAVNRRAEFTVLD